MLRGTAMLSPTSSSFPHVRIQKQGCCPDLKANLKLLNKNKPYFHRNRNPKLLNKHANRLTTISFPFQSSTDKLSLSHSGISSNNSNAPFISPESILLFIYFVTFFCLRLVSTLIPPDFPQRWHNLIVYSEKAEAEAKHYPCHLIQAVVAYEDRRFFRHFGVDPFGIARAVFFFPKGGGGSTITQQVVKNIFLCNDRTFSRKAIEMVLALILERNLSKSKILSCYLGKIYWGHGIYGIQSASTFYFGKHPSLLNLGESALLAGMIPSPELRSPYNNPSRGKTSQARALRRMVDAGFIDTEVAISTGNQKLYLHIDGEEHSEKLLYTLKEEARDSGKLENCKLTLMDIWDWEMESKIWEIREDMEIWEVRVGEIKHTCRINGNNFVGGRAVLRWKQLPVI